MKAFMLGLISAIDDTIADETPTKRVLTLLASLVAFGFSVGLAVATWIGLPNDVQANKNAIGSLAENQKYMVRLITSLECDRKQMGNIECRSLQFKRVQNLKNGDGTQESEEQ